MRHWNEEDNTPAEYQHQESLLEIVFFHSVGQSDFLTANEYERWFVFLYLCGHVSTWAVGSKLEQVKSERRIDSHVNMNAFTTGRSGKFTPFTACELSFLPRLNGSALLVNEVTAVSGFFCFINSDSTCTTCTATKTAPAGQSKLCLQVCKHVSNMVEEFQPGFVSEAKFAEWTKLKQVNLKFE